MRCRVEGCTNRLTSLRYSLPLRGLRIVRNSPGGALTETAMNPVLCRYSVGSVTLLLDGSS